jgi:hypothetical protein
MVALYVCHVLQHHDRNGHDWEMLVSGFDWNSSNCTMASACSLVVRGRVGAVLPVTYDDESIDGTPPPLSPNSMRYKSGDLDTSNPGSGPNDIRTGCHAWGVNLTTIIDKTWATFWSYFHDQKRAASLAVRYSNWPGNKSGAPSFTGNHAVTLHALCDDPRRASLTVPSGWPTIPTHACSNGKHALVGDPLYGSLQWLGVAGIKTSALSCLNHKNLVRAAFTPKEAADPPNVTTRVAYWSAERDSTVALVSGVSKGAGKDHWLQVGLVTAGTLARTLLFPAVVWPAWAKRLVKAELQLRPWDHYYGIGDSAYVRVLPVTDDWVEGTASSLSTTNAVKWSNQPAIDLDAPIVVKAVSAAGSYLNIDLTDQVAMFTPSTILLPDELTPGPGGRTRGFILQACTSTGEIREAGGQTAWRSEFLAWEADTAHIYPRWRLTFDTVLSPSVPADVQPATTDPGTATEAPTRVNPGFSVHGRWVSPDSADSLAVSEVRFYDATATDDRDGYILTGSELTTLTGTGTKSYAVGSVSVDHPIVIPPALVGTEIRGRLRVKGRLGRWSPWTRLLDMRIVGNSPPTAPTGLHLDTSSLTPDMSGVHNDPDAGSSCSSVETQVWKQTTQGLEVIINATTAQPGDPTTGALSTLNGTGGESMGGGVLWTTHWTSLRPTRDLVIGERILRRHRTADQYGAVGAWSDVIGWTVGLAELPLSIPAAGTKLTSLAPTVGASYSSNFDEVEFWLYYDPALSLICYHEPNQTITAATSKTWEYPDYSTGRPLGWLGNWHALTWGLRLWVVAKIHVVATGEYLTTAAAAITVDAAPLAPVVSIVDGLTTLAGDLVVGSLTPTIRAVFVDPDLPNDSPSGRLVEVATEDLGGFVVQDSITSGITEFYAVPGSLLSWETTYNADAAYKDDAARWGSSSAWLPFTCEQPPDVAEGDAPDTADPTTLISWDTTLYGGRTADHAEIVVSLVGADGGLQTLYSETIDGDATGWSVPPYVLPDQADISTTVTVYDNDGLSGSVTITWTTAFTPPDALANLVATPDYATSALDVSCDPSEDTYHYEYVWEGEDEYGEWTEIGRTIDPAIRWYFAPLNVTGAVRVRDSNGSADLSDPLTGSGLVDLPTWWLVQAGGDPAYTFPLHWVEDGHAIDLPLDQTTMQPLSGPDSEAQDPIIVTGQWQGEILSLSLVLMAADRSLVALLRRAARLPVGSIAIKSPKGPVYIPAFGPMKVSDLGDGADRLDLTVTRRT